MQRADAQIDLTIFVMFHTISPGCGLFPPKTPNHLLCDWCGHLGCGILGASREHEPFRATGVLPDWRHMLFEVTVIRRPPILKFQDAYSLIYVAQNAGRVGPCLLQL